MNTTWDTSHSWVPDFSDTDLKIAEMRASFEERRLQRLWRAGSVKVASDIKWAVSNAVSPWEENDDWMTYFQEWVDIDFDKLDAQSNRTIEEILRDFEMEDTSAQSIDRTRLIKWKTKIEVVPLNWDKKLTLTFSRLSGAFDKATKQQFLKFKGDTQEFIWNGVLQWRKAMWGARPKGTHDNYLQVTRFNTEKINYE